MQQNLQQQMTNMQQESQQSFQLITREIQRENQRSINRSIKSNVDPLEKVVRVDDGRMPNETDPPIWFPTNYEDLMAANGDDISDLLHFYGQDRHGLLPARKTRLKRFLGVNL
jgi:hypothetical protein